LHAAHGTAEQDCAVNVPDNVPLLQVRLWLLQLLPHGTELAANAVTDEVCGTVAPQGVVQLRQVTAEQLWLVKLPDSVPKLQERVSLLQVLPHGTELVWKAPILPPWAILPPQGRLQLLPVQVALLVLMTPAVQVTVTLPVRPPTVLVRLVLCPCASNGREALQPPTAPTQPCAAAVHEGV
jgi:hypothetical protein